MYLFTISQQAKDDIRIASKWYNSVSSPTTRKFLRNLRKKILLLTEYPEIKPALYKNIHSAKLDSFPYSIHYTINKKQKRINIVGVFHNSQHPKNWER